MLVMTLRMVQLAFNELAMEPVSCVACWSPTRGLVSDGWLMLLASNYPVRLRAPKMAATISGWYYKCVRFPPVAFWFASHESPWPLRFHGLEHCSSRKQLTITGDFKIHLKASCGIGCLISNVQLKSVTLVQHDSYWVFLFQNFRPSGKQVNEPKNCPARKNNPH